MRKRIISGTMLIALALALTGCSESKFWSQQQGLGSFLTGVAESSHRVPSGSNLPEGLGDKSVQGQLALARLNERQGQAEQAEALYSLAIEKQPKNPLPYHRLAVMRAKEGKFQEADEYFAQALALTPSDPVLLRDVGYSYYLQNRLDEAEAILQRALEIKPNDPAICNNLGVLFGEQGRYREALAMFKRTGTQAQAYANLAFVYAQQGELEKAKENYSRALTLDRKLRPAGEALVQLAQYDQLGEQMATSEQSSPTRSELVQTPGGSGVWHPHIPPTAGRPEIEPRAVTQRTHEAYAQQATFLVDEPVFGTAVAADSPPVANFEPSGSVTNVGPQASAYNLRTPRPGADIGHRLQEMVSGPPYAGK